MPNPHFYMAAFENLLKKAENFPLLQNSPLWKRAYLWSLSDPGLSLRSYSHSASNLLSAFFTSRMHLNLANTWISKLENISYGLLVSQALMV